MGAARLYVGWMKLAVGLLLTTLGCSTTSTIARIHEGGIEGHITGGSADSIFVLRDGGGECEIKRDDISMIDYPGNVHRNAGIGVLAYGGLNIAAGLPQCEERTQSKAAYCTGVFLPAAIGVGLIVWGLVVEHGQTSAVSDTSRPSPNNTPGSSKLARPCLTPGVP